MKYSYHLILKLCFLIMLCSFELKADNSKGGVLSQENIDRLIRNKPVLRQAKIYDSIAGANANDNPDQALLFSNKAIELARQSSDDEFLGHAYTNRAKSYKQLSEYDKAIANLDTANSIFITTKNKGLLTSVNIDYGNVYYLKGDYSEALRYYIIGEKLAEEANDKALEGICLNNIGNIFRFQGNYDKAIDYYQKAYNLNRYIKDTVKTALALDNIGAVYNSKGEYEIALGYQLSALKMLEKSKNKRFLAEVLMNIGATSQDSKKYDAALNYFKRAIKLNEEIGSKFGMIGCMINMGNVFRSQKKYTEAIEILDRTMELAKEIGVKNYIKETALNLSQAYEEMNQPQKALEYYKMYSDLKDSIFNDESTSQINELSAKYEADKRQKEIELLTKDQDLKNTKLKQKDTINIALFIGIFLVVILMGLVFYRYQEKRKANNLLEEKNFAINEQKELVSEKNREITDSINYARRIQDAMLPSHKILNEYFKDNFIFYQPKDIISGDFYWALRKDDKLYLAAADCTGHGVPGALMSMIGITFLRQIINELNITDTAEILNRLHIMVLDALNEDINSRNSKDGMDLALLKIDLPNGNAQFTGAVRPLYIISKNGFEVVKGDRFSIGGIKTMEESYSSVEIELTSGKSFYMFSDGFADQFGQKNGKKFMVKKLQNLLMEVHQYPMSEQSQKVSEIFNDWKGTLEQTDDVLLLGIKV